MNKIDEQTKVAIWAATYGAMIALQFRDRQRDGVPELDDEFVDRAVEEAVTVADWQQASLEKQFDNSKL
jgi:hypothetical protein